MSDAMTSLLGAPDEPVACKVFSKALAVHWFPSGAEVGDKCLCGKTVKKED
jgi:hypothetical protein